MRGRGIASNPKINALLPAGSRRRATAVTALRRIRPARRDRWTQVEETKLRGTWRPHHKDTLGHYLVSGFQDPRINVQSILARHMLVRELFGREFDSLMHEELAWAVELNDAVRVRAAELGVKIKTTTNAERQADVDRVTEVIADRVDEFAQRWQDALAGHDAPRLRILEYACGSANDYRSFHDYGIARFLDYTGVDLNEANIANARQMFPDVNFRVGSVLDLPEKDRSVDFVIGFDIMEHLSLRAMQHATDSATRICRRGMYFAYFLMDEIPEHVERPVRNYHRNLISAPRIRKEMEERFDTVRLINIVELLRDDHGYPHSHTKRAYSLIAHGPKDA
jgi:ubiquinone/menaquinone biosynthesis C-methylase UbiE